MVIAEKDDEEVTTAIVPRPSSRAGDSDGIKQPVLEIKQKTSSRHEKRTRRDYYRHQGDNDQKPIEYVYTYTEETPQNGNASPDKQSTSTDLVPVNGNGPVSKIECTVGDDGNLVVRIRGKPDKVPLDPKNLPVTLPDGWQLKEIQTNQRSRKTERSRKLKIRDEQVVNEEQKEQAIVIYNEHTLAVNGTAEHASEDELEFGNAEEEEYDQGERNGVAYVQKRTKKYSQGAAGTVTKIEEMLTEQGTSIDHPQNKQQYSRNTKSVLERTESNKRKFSKQSVTDEKVTETYKTNIMYFDGDETSGPVLVENLRDDTTRSRSDYYGRSGLRRRNENQLEGSIIVESPEDSPYNSLERRNRQHTNEDVEIINVDEKYRYHYPEDSTDRRENRARSGKTTTFENRRGYYSEAAPQHESEYDTVEEHADTRDEVKTAPRDYKCEYPVRSAYEKDDRERIDSETVINGNRVVNGDSAGKTVTLRRDQKGNIVEDVEKTNIEEYYRVHPGSRSVSVNGYSRHEETDREEKSYGALNGYRNQDRSDKRKTSKQTQIDERFARYPRAGLPEDVESRTERTETYGSALTPSRPRQSNLNEENTERTDIEEHYRSVPLRDHTQFQNQREDRTETHELRSAPFPRQPHGRNEENTEITRTEEYYRVHPEQRLPGHQDERSERIETRQDFLKSSVPFNRNLPNAHEEHTERTDVREYYRVQPESKQHPHREDRAEQLSENRDQLVSSSVPVRRARPENHEENVEKTVIEEYYRIHPENRFAPSVHQEESETRSERRDIVSTFPPPRPTVNEESSEKTIVEEISRVRQPVSQPETRTTEERTTETREERTAVPQRSRPSTTQQTDSSQTRTFVREESAPKENITEDVEKTTSEEYYRVRPVPPARHEKTERQHSERHELVSQEHQQPSQVPPQQFVNKTTTVKEFYDTRVPQNQRQNNQTVTRHEERTEFVQNSRPGQPAYTDSRNSKMVGTEIRVDGTAGGISAHPEERRTKEERTDVVTSYERTDVKEHRIPVAVTSGQAESRGRTSRLSSGDLSVDLSEIKPGEQILDNRILKDRGNLAQGGSMGLRRPPSRNPAKYNFGDENGPDDIMSTSDITLPSRVHPTYQPNTTRNGHVATSYNSGFYSDENTRLSKSQATSVKQHQQVTRDEQVLVNYVDTSRKPDWVQNIDDHFAGRSALRNVIYNRENVTSPTPKFEEILSAPGATVITVNGEHEPIHGIVTEPIDHFFAPVAEDQTLVHQSEKGSRVGFTRVTDTNGHNRTAKERVSYQEKRATSRQITVSYDVPGVGKETREYIWDGVNQQPEEKFRFEETREHAKDVAVKFAIDQLPASSSSKQTKEVSRQVAYDVIPQYPDERITFDESREQTRDVTVKVGLDHQQTRRSTTETKEVLEKFVFDEVREPARREVTMKLAIENQQEQKVSQLYQPTQAETFHFNEEFERKRDVNFVIGLDQQRAEEAREEYQKVVQENYYYESIPQEKVTFHEDREVARDVSLTLALQPVEPLEPIPVEKIQFEETRVIPAEHPVSVRFGLEEPLYIAPTPRPVSTYSDSTIMTQEIVPQYSRTREDVKRVEKVERTILEPVPEYTHVYEEDLRIEEVRQEIISPPPTLYTVEERTQRVDVIEKVMEVRSSPPKVRAEVEITAPPTLLAASTEIVPPLPRRTSLRAAIEAQEVHHTEVDMIPTPKRVYETTVDLQPHLKREHAEEHIDVKGREPPKLPPTSGRVEKHVNLEKIVPEPTGQHLPQSLGTYGYVYQAHLDAKKPEVEKGIEFYVMEQKAEVVREEEHGIDWYVKEGVIVEEISDKESSVGEVRAATPPHHPELQAAVEVSPPKEVRPVRIPPVLSAEAEITPRYYYGEEDEDRVSVHETKRVEPVVPKKERPDVGSVPDFGKARVEKTEIPAPPPVTISEMIRKIIAEAAPTHHTELTHMTPEEEERWKTVYNRLALPKPKRSEVAVRLKKPEILLPRLPPVSGRILRIKETENLQPEPTGKPLPKVTGTYGFLYIATIEPKMTVPPPQSIKIEQVRTLTTTTRIRESEISFLEIDMEQVLLAAFAEVHPPITITQQEQLLHATAEIFPPLSEGQQERLLNALVEIVPPLTPQQQLQILTTSEEVVPPLTLQQQEQLLYASAEIIPSLTTIQKQQILRASVEIVPPLAPEQQRQLLTAMAEFFPPSRRSEQNFELEEPDRPLPKPSGRIPRKTWSGQLELATTGRVLSKELGTYGFLYVTRVEPLPHATTPSVSQEISFQSIDIDIQQVITTVISEIQPPLTVQQERSLLEAAIEIFPPLTTVQQERLLDVLTEIRPPLTPHQTEQLLSGTAEIVPALTNGQMRQLSTASYEIITMTVEQERRLLYASTRLVPPLTSEQQHGLLTAMAEVFPSRGERRLEVEVPHSSEHWLPEPSGRRPPKTWSGQLQLSSTGRILAKEMGTYGFLYATHVKPKPSRPGYPPTSQEITIQSIELDVEQLITTVISEVQPPMTTRQEEEFLEASVRIFSPLTPVQQEQLLNVVTEIRPPLTAQQTHQLLTGSEEISPRLTNGQLRQLLVASAEIITITVEQERELLRISSHLTPSLTSEQQHGLLSAVADWFPSQERIEELIQLEDWDTTSPTPSDRRLRYTTRDRLQPGSELHGPRSIGTYGFVYLSHIDAKSRAALEGEPMDMSVIDSTYVELDYHSIVSAAVSDVQPALTTEQEEQLVAAADSVFQPLTEQQQESLLRALAEILPVLTSQQQVQILSGSEEVTPELTEEQRRQLLIVSSKIVKVTVDVERQLLFATTNVRPELTADQRQQIVTSVMDFFPIPEKVERMIKLDQLRNIPQPTRRSRKPTSETAISPVPSGRFQPLALGIFGYLFSTHVDNQPAFHPGRPLDVSNLDHSTVQLDVRKAVLSILSNIEPSLSTKQTSELFSATVEVISHFSDSQQRRVLNALTSIRPHLTIAQQRQILTGNEVHPTVTDEQREQLLIYSAEIFSVAMEQERELEYIAANVYPPISSSQQQQFMRAVTMLFPTLDKVAEMLDLDRLPTPTSGGRRTPRPRSVDRLHRSAAPQQSRALGVYGFIYMAHVDSLALSSGRPVDMHQIDFRTIEIDSSKVLLSIFDEIQPALTTEQEDELFSKAIQIIPVLNEDQQQKLLKSLSEVRPALSPVQLHQLLGGNEISPPLSQDQQEQLLRSSAHIVSLSYRQELELIHLCENLYPPMTPSQQQQFLSSISRLFPAPGKVTQVLQELRATSHQPKALGTFGFLYMTNLDAKDIKEFQSLNVDLRETEVSSIEIDIEHVLLAAFESIQPPLSHKQQHQLLTASRDIFPSLTLEQQRKILNVLVQLLPPLSIRQQRMLLSGSDVVIPPLTTRQQQQLFTASGEVFTLTTRMEKEIIYASSQVHPPLSPDHQRQLLSALREIFPSSPKSRADTLIGRFEHTHETERRTRIEETEQQYGRINDRGVWERTGAESRNQQGRVMREISQFDLPSHPRPPRAYEEEHPDWIDETRHLQVGKQNRERYIGHVDFADVPQYAEPLRGRNPRSPERIRGRSPRRHSPLSPARSRGPSSRSPQRFRGRSPESPERFRGRSPRSPEPRNKDSGLESSLSDSVDGDRALFAPSTFLGVTTYEYRDRRGAYNNLIYKRDSDEDFSDFEEELRFTPDDDLVETTPFWPRDHLSPIGFVRHPAQLRHAASQLKHYSGTLDSGKGRLETPLYRRDRLSPVGTAQHPAQLKYAKTGAPFSYTAGSKTPSYYTRDHLSPVGIYHTAQPKYDRTGALFSHTADPEVQLYPRDHLSPVGTAQNPAQLKHARATTAYSYTRGTGKVGMLTPEWHSVLLEAKLRKTYRMKQEGRRKAARASLSPDSMKRLRREMKLTENYLPGLDSLKQEEIKNKLEKEKEKEKEEKKKKKVQKKVQLEVKKEEPVVAPPVQAPPPVEEKPPEPVPPPVVEPDPFAAGELNTDLFGPPGGFAELAEKDDKVKKEPERKPSRHSKHRRKSTNSSASGGRRLTLREMQARTMSPDKDDTTLDVLRVLKARLGTGHCGDRDLELGGFRLLCICTAGGILTEKDVTLPDQKNWLSEQMTAFEEENVDLEVSAISMNVKPRVKSEILMAPSPPAAHIMSPATGGFSYSATSQHGSPPLTEYSGFMYEAQMDGNHSPMSAEMGRYGFTYQATLDGSEPYRKLTEFNMGHLEMHAESRRRSEPSRSTSSSSNGNEVKPMSATPPWSTPPVTPTPKMATPPAHSRGTTPMPVVKELPEPSKDSVWKKPQNGDSSSWGRTQLDKSVVGEETKYPTHSYTFGMPPERQEVRGDLYSPEDEIEVVTKEITQRRRVERESYEQPQRNVRLARFVTEEDACRRLDDTMSRMEEEVKSLSEITSRKRQERTSEERQFEPGEAPRKRPVSVAAPTITRNVPESTDDDKRPEWVRLAEAKRGRSAPPQPPPKPREVAGRSMERLTEEKSLDETLERILDQRSHKRADTSPSQLRKWDKIQSLADSSKQGETSVEEESFSKSFHRRETTSVEERFDSDHGMVESGSESDSNLKSRSSMSQSLPSLGPSRGTGKHFGRLGRGDAGTTSLEELQKSSRTVRRNDEAEEEVKDESFSRRGDAVVPETKRTKRTVVRKLIDGQWKEIAVREEDVPVEVSDLAMEVDPHQPAEHLRDAIRHRDDDEWSLTSDAIIEETTTTRTVRRIEEEEEDIISLSSSQL